MNLKTEWKQYIKPVLIILLILVILISLQLFENNENPVLELNESTGGVPQELTMAKQEEASEQPEKDVKTPTLLFVDVKGAVVKPNVYKFTVDSRVLDAINMAGGFTADADQTKINLAALLHDEMVVYVPKIGEDVNVSEFAGTENEADGKININTATADELQSLPGIGPSKAASIIAYREENGPFENVADLVNVSGIGEKSLEKISEQITVR